METETIDELLIMIIKEFTQVENFQRILNEQVLANAVFYSFAMGALKHAEGNEVETIEDLQYVRDWIESKQNLLMGFKVSEENE